MREIFVVIPTTNRHEMLNDLLDGIQMPSTHVILLDNNSDPPLVERFGARAFIYTDRAPELNIQKWWNHGWEIAERFAKDKNNYAVVFLNSDALTTRDYIEALVRAIDRYDASVTFFDHCGILWSNQIARRTKPGPGPWAHKMTGWGFAVRGELKTRFDENMAWWYGDDDFDWRARDWFGGVVMIPGVWIHNQDPNGAQRDRPELHKQIEKDREFFLAKWGTDILDESVDSKGWIEDAR